MLLFSIQPTWNQEILYIQSGFLKIAGYSFYSISVVWEFNFFGVWVLVCLLGFFGWLGFWWWWVFSFNCLFIFRKVVYKNILHYLLKKNQKLSLVLIHIHDLLMYFTCSNLLKIVSHLVCLILEEHIVQVISSCLLIWCIYESIKESWLQQMGLEPIFISKQRNPLAPTKKKAW